MATESDVRLQAALVASARAEASLTGLFRAIQQLGNGVGGAREANESLTLELEGLRDLLGATSERQQVFERKVAELELVLDRTRKEHARERGFLIDQQDLFLVKLIDEQELELKRRDDDLDTLRGRLAELERSDSVTLPPPAVQPSSEPYAAVRLVELDQPAESASSELDRAELAELERTAQKLAEDRERARETVARLQAQRDEAQNAVARIGKERDDAFHEIHRLKSELGGPRIPMSTLPPSNETRRDSSAARAQAARLSLDQLALEGHLGQAVSPASLPTSPPASFASASSPIMSSASDSPRGQPISSVLRPPRSNPYASPIPSRLSPAAIADVSPAGRSQFTGARRVAARTDQPIADATVG
ncbi:MAG: hypothetical protein WDO74_07980 [Pseudomonadota bacterium]